MGEATGAGEGIRTLDPNLGKILLLCAHVDIARFSSARNAGFRAPFRGFRGQWHRIGRRPQIVSTAFEGQLSLSAPTFGVVFL